MKRSLLFFLLIVTLLPISLTAAIPGRYKLVVPSSPPPRNSLEKVKIVEVFSFGCGHCLDFNEKVYPKLKKKYGNKLEFTGIPIGWDGHDPGRFYYIAKENGKGHDVMMDLFHTIITAGLGKTVFKDRKQIQKIAVRHNLTKEFSTKMDSLNIIEQMVEGVNYAKDKGIRSTPTLVIENSIIPLSLSYSNLVKIIDALLK